MEYFQILLVNDIVHYFQQICITVKPYQEVFIGVVLKHIIILPVQNSISDICLSHAMFECRWNKFDKNTHINSIKDNNEAVKSGADKAACQ